MDCIRNGRRQYRLQQTVDGRRQFRLQETVGGSRYNEDGSMWAGCTVSKCVTRNTEARDSGHNLTINETTIVWPSQWVGVSLQEITDLSVCFPAHVQSCTRSLKQTICFCDKCS